MDQPLAAPGASCAAPWAGVVEPVPRELWVLLRLAVLTHAHQERRRVHPPVVHVGTPGGAVATFALGGSREGPRLDHALRTDVLEAMVRRADRAGGAASSGPGRTLVWLTRPGPLEPRDVDLAWLAATRAAAAELGRVLPMVVVNRRSWRDPATGVAREWTRLRRAPARAEPA